MQSILGMIYITVYKRYVIQYVSEVFIIYPLYSFIQLTNTRIKLSENLFKLLLKIITLSVEQVEMIRNIDWSMILPFFYKIVN